MPLAVTHVLLTIILVDLFRDYILKNHKRYMTLHTVMIAGIAGLMPDIDIPLNWILGLFGKSISFLHHGGFTHTAFFGLIFLIPGFIFWKIGKEKIGVYFFVICFGIIFHVFLDFFVGGGAYEGVMWFWPLSSQVYKIHLLGSLGLQNLSAGIDALILLGWLWHEEMKHKISDFI